MSLNIPSSYTPMLRQYFELKATVPETLLFFRMGDFYEVFGEDAKLVSSELNIVLTGRDKGDKSKIPFCGVPHHSVSSYLNQLIAKGYKLSIAEQVEKASESKGLVKREIVQVLTPGTYVDLDSSSSKCSEYLACFYEDPETQRYVTAFFDMSAAEFRYAIEENLEKACAWLKVFSCKELLTRTFCKPLFKKDQLLLSFFDEAFLRDGKAQAAILEKQNISLKNITFEFPQDKASLSCTLSALLYYLKNLGHQGINVSKISCLYTEKKFCLDSHSLKGLEVFGTQEPGFENIGVHSYFDKICLNSSHRLLSEWIHFPLKNAQDISFRQAQVQALFNLENSGQTLHKIRQRLLKIFDLDKLATKLSRAQLLPSDYKKILHSLEACEKITFDLKSENSLAPHFPDFGLVSDHIEALRALLAPALSHDEGRFFLEGYSTDLDALEKLRSQSQEILDTFLSEIKARSFIANLRIKFHKNFGYLLEVSKSYKDKLPSECIRVQTLVNAERFSHPELTALGEKILSADENFELFQTKLLFQLYEKLLPLEKSLREIAHFFAKFDLLQAFSDLLFKEQFCLAKISDSWELVLENSRHPFLEKKLGASDYVANTLKFNSEARIMLLSGPNMGGKSTLMRQLGLSALLHQIGSPIPASKACLPIFDQIYTRIGAHDRQMHGESTFMVEMTEVADILKGATEKSLILIDEIGRGTSTVDGSALARSVLSYISDNVGALCVFATHFHDIAIFSQSLISCFQKQVEVSKQDGKLVLTHRLIEGSAKSSFGIEIAEMAKLPDSVIERARQFMSGHKREQKKPVVKKAQEKNHRDFIQLELI